MDIDVAALELLPAETVELSVKCSPSFTCGTTNCGETRVVN
jgi:hypothetical protein